MKRIIRLTETDLKRIVRRVIREAGDPIMDPCKDKVDKVVSMLKGKKIPAACLSADMTSECMTDIMSMVAFPSSQLLTAVNELIECRNDNDDMMH